MNKVQINFLRPDKKIDFQPEEKKANKKWLIIFFIIFCVVAFGSGCIAKKIILNKWPDDPVAYDNQTLQPKKTGFFQTVKNFLFAPENVLEGQNEDRINILLLGIGGEGHDGPYLSDTNMILSINPKTNEVAMISIPRDLGVKIDGNFLRKINYADAYGEQKHPGYGGEYARQIFEKTFSINIPYYIRVDFSAFKELIDIVGGVNITVDRSFVDYSYPGANDSYQTVTFQAGEQYMDGEMALKFSRSRHGNNGEGSDFARSHRQQKVITALKQKVLSSATYTNPIKIKGLYDSVAAHLATNLNFGQIMYLASIAKDVDMNKIKNLVIDDGVNGYLYSRTIDGNWLLIPKTGNFDEINAAVKNVFDPTYQFKSATSTPAQAETRPNAEIEIQNGTWEVGLAGKTQKKLVENGFNISAIGNSNKRPVSSTMIYLINSKANSTIVDALKKQLQFPIATSIPDWLQYNYDDPQTAESEIGSKYATSTEILIILGADIIDKK